MAPKGRAAGVGTGDRLIVARSGAAFRAQFFLMPNPGLKPRAESLSPFGTAIMIRPAPLGATSDLELARRVGVTEVDSSGRSGPSGLKWTELNRLG